MTCKDCIHYDVCLPNSAAYGHKLKPCSKFKNKADFVEVVRCCDCKKWKINPNNLYGGYCRHCEGASIDHFCSYGKRK